MEIAMQVIDWVLRITGLGSIIIILINLFIKDYEYIENVKIISNPSGAELNQCKSYAEYNEEGSACESTLFVPLSCNVKKLKLYEVIVTERGKIKKGKLLAKFKNLEPYNGVLFNVTRGCAVPRHILEWKIDYGFKAREELDANGFNGNNNEKVIQYGYGLIAKIRKIFLIK